MIDGAQESAILPSGAPSAKVLQGFTGLMLGQLRLAVSLSSVRL